jgi:hypothetical protein
MILSVCFTHAQTVVKGVVRDAVTQLPIQAVSVVFKGGKGVATGADGSYYILLQIISFQLYNILMLVIKLLPKQFCPKENL